MSDRADTALFRPTSPNGRARRAPTIALQRSVTHDAHVFRCDLFVRYWLCRGAALFLLVDKHEADGPMARLLKFLILFVVGVAILHKLQPYGLALFSNQT